MACYDIGGWNAVFVGVVTAVSGVWTILFLFFPEWVQSACRGARKGLEQTVWARAVARIFLGVGLDYLFIDDRHVWVLRVLGVLPLFVFAGALVGVYCAVHGALG